MADDFSKAGNDGGKIPPGYDADEPGTTVVHGPDEGPPPLPSPLECGKHYELEVTRERGGVAPADRVAAAEALYEQALDFLRLRANELKCPANCGPIHTWIAKRSWEYSKQPQRTSVRVRLTLGAVCPRKDDVRPPGLRRPEDVEFEDDDHSGDDKSFDAEHPPAARDWWKIEGLGASIRCSDERLVRFRYYADVTSCATPNYAQHVGKARDLAKWYADNVRCRDARIHTFDGVQIVDCIKRAGRVRTEWKCWPEANVVEVSVYWSIRCIAPRLR